MSRRETILRRSRAALLVTAALATLLWVAVAVGFVASRATGPFVAGLAVLAVVLIAAAKLVAALARRLPRRCVLELDLTESLPDVAGGDPLARLAARGRPTLRQVVEALEGAASDGRIFGLFARVGGNGLRPADLQELHDAVVAFRASGKFAVAHAETFGEFAAGNGAYWLASAFDEVHLQPSGDVGLTGLAAEVNFLRGLLDKAGIVAQLDHRHEYKNAKNLLTERSFTPAHREATARIVASLHEQLVGAVAEGRGLGQDAVDALVDRGPVLGPEAVEAGLVDRLAYRDDSIDDVKQRAGDGARLVSVTAYHKRLRPARRAPTVAVIHGIGAVTQGRSRPNPLTVRSMGSDTVATAFRSAIDDKRVKAILFRVDSPGGSYVASDAIWHQTLRARKAGKPVVVSMGNVAGSGGYFVSMAADRIVAHPATVTGSIGVVGGKTVLGDLKAKVGITTDEVHEGAQALLWSRSRGYTAEQWGRLQRWLDRVYEDFVTRVAEARDLPLERVREIAKGRVWTGADALDLGLVDELGGYPAALRAVRELIGLAPDAPLRLRSFPRRPRLSQRLGGGERPGMSLPDLADVVGPLTMPPPPRLR